MSESIEEEVAAAQERGATSGGNGASEAALRQAAAPQKGTVAELLDAFNISWAAPRTFAALLHAPDEVAEAYLRRRNTPKDPLVAEIAGRYLSPFKYIVLATALFTFLSAFVFDMSEIMQQASEMGAGWGASIAGGDAEAASMDDFAPPVRAFLEQAQEVGVLLSTRYMAVAYLCLLLPAMAFFTCLLHKAPSEPFRGALQSHFALNTYIWAEANVLMLSNLAVFALTESYVLYGVLGFIILVGYVIWAQTHVFNLNGWRGAVQATIAFFLGYVVYFVLQTLATYGIAAVIFFT